MQPTDSTQSRDHRPPTEHEPVGVPLDDPDDHARPQPAMSEHATPEPATTADGTSDGEGEASAREGAAEESFSLMRAFGGWGALLDAGLPGVAFVAVYALTGQNLRVAVIVAIAVGAAFAIVRIVRKDPMTNVVSGFIGVAIAAALASATGKAENFYLPGLLLNAGYFVGWLIANLVRWPLIGLVIGVSAGWGFEWRKDPVLLRAFSRAGWIWVGFFALRLAIQGPLYFYKELGAIAVARIAMGWPLWLVVVGLSYIVIKGSVPPDRWQAVRRAAEQAAGRVGRR